MTEPASSNSFAPVSQNIWGTDQDGDHDLRLEADQV